MDTLWLLIALAGIVFTLAMTILGAWMASKPRPLGVGRLLLTVTTAPLGLLFYVLAGGQQLRPWLGVLAFLVGILPGAVFGMFTKIYRRGGKIIGTYSVTVTLLWGAALALSAFCNLLPSLLISALGLLALCFASGIHLGNYSTLLLRRILV